MKRINDLGYEVAAHSDMHRAAYTQNRADYKEDLSDVLKLRRYNW